MLYRANPGVRSAGRLVLHIHDRKSRMVWKLFLFLPSRSTFFLPKCSSTLFSGRCRFLYNQYIIFPPGFHRSSS